MVKKSTTHGSKPGADTAPAASHVQPATPAIPALPEGAHDLAGLKAALGAPEEAFRRLIFRHLHEADFYEWGVRAETGRILADVPRFVSSSLRILANLSDRQRALVLLPPAIFGLIVDEATKLSGMFEKHGNVAGSEGDAKAERELKLKEEMGLAVTLRDRVLGAARGALGQERAQKAREAAGDASSAEAMAKGLKALAAFLDEAATAADDALALEIFGAGPATRDELRARAKDVEDAGMVKADTAKRVSKRALDIQDGRVLTLMDTVHRAFRLARRSDHSILLPELNKLSGLLDQSSGGAAAPAPPPPAATPPK
jgi:hypothetical protein